MIIVMSSVRFTSSNHSLYDSSVMAAHASRGSVNFAVYTIKENAYLSRLIMPELKFYKVMQQRVDIEFVIYSNATG